MKSEVESLSCDLSLNGKTGHFLGVTWEDEEMFLKTQEEI